MVQMHLGTAPLDDDALVEAIESCGLPAAQLHHADHIRLAWIYLGRFSEQEATVRIERTIRSFAAHNGVPEKYHHTITVAWMRLVAAAREATPQSTRFEEFAEMHPELLAVEYLDSFYSKKCLASCEARAGWVDPDISGLP
jgi:hypothetical protein